MILVTGATGTVGSALLTELAGRGAPVRALAHSAASLDRLEGQGVDAVEGDLDRPETVEAAAQGCDHLFLLSPPAPSQPQREIGAIDAARRAGVEHVVALSVTGAHARSPVVSVRWHAEIDDHLVASGLGHTILRPAGFMSAHLLPVGTVRSQGTWYGMTGDGPAGFVDAADVAAVAAAVLTTPGHDAAVYELTGPEAMTVPQAAAQLSEVIGRPVAYVDLPAERYRSKLAAAGLPDWLADSLVALYRSIREGHAATVTNHVEQLTGRPARSYREFAEAHKEVFDA